MSTLGNSEVTAKLDRGLTP